jgi:hypothetical protein
MFNANLMRFQEIFRENCLPNLYTGLYIGSPSLCAKGVEKNFSKFSCGLKSVNAAPCFIVRERHRYFYALRLLSSALYFSGFRTGEDGGVYRRVDRHVAECQVQVRDIALDHF